MVESAQLNILLSDPMPAGDRHPFAYPQDTHCRRHDPPQFADYPSYKDYLRDEFVFACVYCLSRETWNPSAAAFGVDHYLPKSRHEAGRVEYTNLLYACNECNRYKADQKLPPEMHPEANPYGKHMTINSDGTIKAETPDGRRLIRLLYLDRRDLNRWRLIHYGIYALATRTPGGPVVQQMLHDFFGFPANMPDFGHRKGATNPYATRPNLPSWY